MSMLVSWLCQCFVGFVGSQLASTVFTWGTIAVLPFYTLMVLAPKSELTKKSMESNLPYVVLGALYAYLLFLSWTPETVQLIFASKYLLPELTSIGKMFSSELTLASAWIHLLVVDLFAARNGRSLTRILIGNYLSNNILIGTIPSSLGKLTNLEALDLSLNRLSGKIPQQLAQLTFWSSLRCPSTTSQLLKKCIDHIEPSFSPPSASDDGDNDSESFFELYWNVILIGYVGGLVAGVALGSTFYSDVLVWLKRVIYPFVDCI
ncbi:hypothetical protein L195_g004943 [Trifolium pratense]|uniref:Uncharacterized protein n=1 Tax=Trifolium pratense TaxID=57577 RepID=A0A2K3NZH1_TRIPR|nr:hypothetical protein L195_g004943 [Trifolium pratense]